MLHSVVQRVSQTFNCPVIVLLLEGVQLINETPVTGSGGKKYAFIHPKSANGVMVELYEL